MIFIPWLLAKKHLNDHTPAGDGYFESYGDIQRLYLVLKAWVQNII
ncbi:MAG: hypothetical protein JO297_12445 [Nitrososphaeraceae archaeon]|nr:hypothetical protein [Nitrososphaeraceae archaeon]